MAVDSSFTQEHQKAPGPQNNDQFQTKAPGAANFSNGNIFDIMSRIGTSQSLNAGITDYIKALNDAFNDKDAQQRVKVVTHRLVEPIGAHAFVVDKHAVILMFTELLPTDTQNLTPMSDQGLIAYTAMRDRLGADIHLVNIILVQPGDYQKVDAMYNRISTDLAIATNSEYRINVSAINRTKLRVDTDTSNAVRFISRMSTSSVLPRIDYGFTVLAKKNRQPGSFQNNVPDEMVPVAAVGAYTEILRVIDPQTRMPKYAPMVHITEIACEIPTAGMLGMLVAIAADQFIANSMWMQPFLSFKKGEPNLGNLFPDPADPNKLWFIKNQQELQESLSTNFILPALAIDVLEGRARIPYLKNYAYPQFKNEVYNDLTSFFSSQVSFNPNVNPCFVFANDFVGTYGDNSGALRDSRDIDYINLVSRGGQDASLQLLLQYPQYPTDRARLVSDKTSNTFKSLYRRMISVIDPTVLQSLAGAVQNSVIIEAPHSQNRMTNTDWMIGYSRSIGTANFNVSRATNTIFNQASCYV